MANISTYCHSVGGPSSIYCCFPLRFFVYNTFPAVAIMQHYFITFCCRFYNIVRKVCVYCVSVSRANEALIFCEGALNEMEEKQKFYNSMEISKFNIHCDCQSKLELNLILQKETWQLLPFNSVFSNECILLRHFLDE